MGLVETGAAFTDRGPRAGFLGNALWVEGPDLRLNRHRSKNKSTIPVHMFTPPLPGDELNICQLTGEHNMNTYKRLF